VRDWKEVEGKDLETVKRRECTDYGAERRRVLARRRVRWVKEGKAREKGREQNYRSMSSQGRAQARL